ncbi:MAG: 2-oxoglutarate dehydrogenase E1 component [Gammaproteobacteria bacterium]|nr:2-oxoglutarate dehydrogenase E1 component [Gammaproteobacteria bacterium]MCH9744934.1 2-oxoglutarate dehydrogenase E1 component [Gammaproteobacteria bacterium]
MKQPPLNYDQLQQSSYLAGGNAPYIEALYDQYLQDPSMLDAKWRTYFDSFANGGGDVSHHAIREQFKELAREPNTVVEAVAPSDQQEAVDSLIRHYRRFGYLQAKIDPLGTAQTPDARLSLAYHQLNEADLDKTFATRDVLPQQSASLREILERLNRIYCGSVGCEYGYMENAKEVEWLRNQVETRLPQQPLDTATKKRILQDLVAADGLEKYLEVRYIGQKRFSIEGGDTLIPMINEVLRHARSYDMREVVIGMAHRGRLNVLLNIAGQSPAELFQEFDGTMDYGLTSGDVKYHRGFSSDIETPSGPLHLTLAFNPSHLEFINPVALGSISARQKRNGGDARHEYAMAILIHGDAAFSGQGVVMETLNMSQTRAYCVGGAIHIVLNNQVGYTAANSHDTRSSRYCSDPAKMIDAPIFHVNGDDPEAAVEVMLLALDYRNKFKKDVVIDFVCYRKRGHQEVDEPRATNPLMYQKIDVHPEPYKIYSEQLVKEGVVEAQQVEKLHLDYRDNLDKGIGIVRTLPEGLSDHYAENWSRYIGQSWQVAVDTRVPKQKIVELGERLDSIPEHFELHRNVKMIVDARRKMTAGEQPLDWGYAEIMAYATLLDEGHPVRLTGEDSRRGTFFHRHAFVYDQKTGEGYMPLQHVSDRQAYCEIYDSLLSEIATLGFEYGYSTTDPNMLVEWEAQFGDFANGGQVIIDQFISSAWQKWNRLSGLTMLLPHGMEGMGPEHSSARLERFLQLCAQDNMQVCVPTTPAQIFHLLRRQVVRPYRKPLIVMSPKSLLRHRRAVSSLDDLSDGCFQLIIPETESLDNSKVSRLIACSGKVYYELLAKREEEGIKDIAIIRFEQLYPFPYDDFEKILESYPNLKQVVWCQEEPKNQGAWFTSRHRIIRCISDGVELCYVGRRSMAAPAAGYPALHKQQLQTFLEQAFALEIQEKDKVKF